MPCLMSLIEHLFLIDPVVLGLLVALHLALLKPQVDLLLRGLDGVGAVADVAADVLLQTNTHQHTLFTNKTLINMCQWVGYSQ